MDGSKSGHPTELVVVALPSDEDHVWKVSSEKVPHMTLLYLGENQMGDQISQVAQFIQHAASTLSRFGLSVDRRGELGDKNADVLFFEKNFNYKTLEKFRANLRSNELIEKAYLSATQYPSWTPHLTLGYPDTPAKQDDPEYRFTWVNFDRIAFWTSDSEGPTFQLKSYDQEVSMSQAQLGEDFLAHYGVKGMKWGKHKAAIKEARSADHIRTADIKSKAKTTRVSSLTNAELQTAIARMNLEKQWNTLNPKKGPIAQGQKFVKTLLGIGKQANEVVAYSNSPTGKMIRDGLQNAATSRARNGAARVAVRAAIGM